MPPESVIGRAFPVGRLERLALVLWGLIICTICCHAFVAPYHRSVYATYANAGRAWLDGVDVYSKFERSPDLFRYSPAAAVLTVPFSVLPDSVGGALWRLLNIAAFVAAFSWWVRSVLPEGRSLSSGELAGMWLLLIPLVLGSMNNGQANTLVTALVLGGVTAAGRARWNSAALCLAAATLLKVYPSAVALLLILMYPRPFAVRFLAALGAGLSLPFLAQAPDYVVQEYGTWFRLLATDDRTNLPLSLAPSDLRLLLRLVQMPLSEQAYLLVQLLSAALAAAACLAGRLAGAERRRLLTFLTNIACCWMTLCGPATEGSTYILLAPTLAWGVLQAWHERRSVAVRLTIASIAGLFYLNAAAGAFPGGHALGLGAQPLAALLLTVHLMVIHFPSLFHFVAERSAAGALA